MNNHMRHPKENIGRRPETYVEYMGICDPKYDTEGKYEYTLPTGP